MDAWLTLAQSQNLSIQQARLQQQYADDARRVEKAVFIHRLMRLPVMVIPNKPQKP